ncbi:MAG: RagB/SusD family nutrient uptake outer membrane protein [Bacteroidales bacterium]|nr:RagB/SusD family nutrient uptake outer membrane protein [Bacteroidales bacterium]
MKQLKYFIGILFAGVITSCSYLDVVPDNVATLDNAFSDRFTAEKYLYTCYSYLPNFGDSWSSPTFLGGDECWYPDRLWWNNGFRLAKGEQNITSPRFDFWGGHNSGQPLFTGIRTCNIFLENIDKVKDLPEYEKLKWKAEVNFLKAYYHFYLVRMYGPIPIQDVSLPVYASTEKIHVQRDPLDSCFNYIVHTLDKAMPDLPMEIEQPSTELGRITRPIAAAVKARVLITAASPLFNGNPDYSSVVAKDGTPLFPTEYDPGKWEKAATACKEAIDMAESAGFHLIGPDDLESQKQHEDSIEMKLVLRSRVTQRWNPEIIWSSTSGIANGLQSESTPRLYPAIYNPVAARLAPTIRIAEQYYSKNGVPIEEDKDYDYSGRYNLRMGDLDHKYFIALGEKTVSLHFEREYRFYADLAFDRSLWTANGKYEDDNDSWVIMNRKGEYSSIFEVSQYSTTGYWPKKLVHLQNEIKNGSWYYITDYAFPVMRLADLYLYYAEALNEVNGPGAEVYDYIDRVRNRAGLDGVVQSWADHSRNPEEPLSKSGLRKIIHRERLIEMAFEGDRFWDLRRWKEAQQYMNKAINGWDVYKYDPKEYYRMKPLFVQSFSVRDYLWPIPEDELVLNPNMVQNPGW